jgi:hypothetical protein
MTVLELFDSLPWVKTGADWTAWRAFLAAVYGLPMTEREYEIFTRCTGRRDAPTSKAREAWVAVGRRGRKSAIEAVIGVYESVYRDLGPYLAFGETSRCLVMAADKDEASQIHHYAEGILTTSSLRYLLSSDPTAETITLRNRTEIKIRAFSLTGGRSRAIHVALLDEVAFFPTKDSAIPDTEVLRGIRPGMANVPGALLVAMSSPYAERGELYEHYRDHFGVEGDPVLFWKAPTLTMHDTEAIRIWVQHEYERDPVAAQAEVGAEFRKDVVGFISREVLDQVTMPGVAEIEADVEEPGKAANLYFGFVDTSGGSNDSFTLGVAHWDLAEGLAYLDLLAEWAPGPDGSFSPKQATKEACALLKPYRVGFVTGDKYAGHWPRERFKDEGVHYRVVERDRNQLYRDMLPILTSRQCRIVDNKKLVLQLQALERKVTPTGREIITHPPGGHDDLANAAAGALVLAYEWGKDRVPVVDQAPPKDTHELVEREYARAAQRAIDDRWSGEAELAIPDYEADWEE